MYNIIGGSVPSYSSGIALGPIFAILSFILALVGAILVMIMVTPEKKRASLPAFFKALHDLFNFKYLVIEKILKFFYIFFTLYTILDGFFGIFLSFGAGYNAGSAAFMSLLSMVLGPIVVRLIFEASMLIIILVKNVIQINNKLKNQNDEPNAADMFATPDISITSVTKEAAPAEPEVVESQPENWLFCSQCGTKYDANKGDCPACGKK